MDLNPRVVALGAGIAVVGNGNVAQAARFAQERELPFPLFTDPSLATYAAAGMRRGVGTVVGVGATRAGARAWRAGHRQSATEGDPWQQGGAYVIAPGSRVLFAQVSDFAGDHFAPDQALAALTRARAASPG